MFDRIRLRNAVRATKDGVVTVKAGLLIEAYDEIGRLQKLLDDIIDGVNWDDSPFDEKAYRARDAYRG